MSNFYQEILRNTRKGTVKQIYRDVGEWIEDLSRGAYAVLVGVLTGFFVLIVSLFLGDVDFTGAITITATQFVVFYIFDLRQIRN